MNNFNKHWTNSNWSHLLIPTVATYPWDLSNASPLRSL